MERVVVEKQVVVVEEVALRVRQVEEVQHYEGMLARERLRVQMPPELEVTPRPEDRIYPGGPAGRIH
jgi:stress response protein YsnF